MVISSFIYLRIFLLPLQIQMGKEASKLGKVLKSVCTAVLICATGCCCFQVSAFQKKAKEVLASANGTSDTIILDQERSRGRLILDFVKKLAFIPHFLQFSILPVQVTDLLPGSLTQIRYSKNVLYIYAISEVP